MRRSYSYSPRPRPRAVWAASITSTGLCVLTLFGVLLPVLGLIASADGTTAGVLDVPVGPITLAVLIGYLLAIVLLVVCFRMRNGALAWTLGVAAVVSTLLVSLWPIAATAMAGAGQVQGMIPAIRELIGRLTGS